MSSEYDFLNSLELHQLQNLLALHPATASSLTVNRDERSEQAEYQKKRRAKLRDLKIPVPKDIERRKRCLFDAELFLTTYFPDVFSEAFTEDRRDMVSTIVNAALHGGDQAIAGPRGEGKSTLAIYTALFLMVAGLSRFPVVVGKSQGKSQNELKAIKEKLQQSELFIADFPEIGVPFEAIGGWSSRARMQTVEGQFTNIELAADHLIFPTITREQLQHWPTDIEPVSCGQIIASVGVDGPIRGTKHRDERPSIAIIDDIEDRESAASDVLIAKNEEIIEQDIAGLGPSGRRVSRVMLCTIQNRKCIAYKYTDPKQKPSWNGRRYRKMVKRPDRMDLVEQYIELRRMRSVDDPDAREAFRFWRDNQTVIESGSVVSNRSSFDDRTHADGEPLELSACHAYFNRVADVGEKAVATEIDNDPPEENGPIGLGLTADVVASRVNGLAKRQLPSNTIALTAAIDLGKYRCHWVVCGWWHGAGGCVVDYGIQEVYGTDQSMDHEASEPSIYRALLQWRDEMEQKEFVDAFGVKRKVDFKLVDSGAFTNAAYQFCREVKGNYHPSKGYSPYRQRAKNTATTIAGANLHASRLESQGLWLYELDSDYWKQWVHERFLTPTFDENNMLRRGSLSLFHAEGKRQHGVYAQHIVAEELVSEFKEGKGAKTYWTQKDDNNHWLDATYMCAAGSEICGVKLIAPSEQEIQPRHVEAKQTQHKQAPRKQHGQAKFRHRPGGWIRGLKRG